jgi:hypothetical protein
MPPFQVGRKTIEEKRRIIEHQKKNTMAKIGLKYPENLFLHCKSHDSCALFKFYVTTLYSESGKF